MKPEQGSTTGASAPIGEELDRQTAPQDANLRSRMYQLECDVESNHRYHAHRRSFFDTLHKLTMLGVLLTGSAAFSNFLGQPEWFGAAAAVLAALDMVFGYSHKARDHEMSFRRYADLVHPAPPS